MNIWANVEIYDKICKEVSKMADEQAFKEALAQEKLKDVVLVCNRENKHKLLLAIPTLCILGTDLCDDQIYMVTDKDMADNIRNTLNNIRTEY